MPSNFRHEHKVSLKAAKQDSSHKRVLSQLERPVTDWLRWYGSYLTVEKCESDEKKFKASYCCKRVTKQR